MLGDLDLMQCAQKDAPTMRRLSVELSGSQNSTGKDIPSLRRVSCSSVSSTHSATSQEGISSPALSSSMPNSFYFDRVNSLLGRATSVPMERAGHALPSIPGSAQAAAGIMSGAPPSPPRPLHLVNSTPIDPLGSGRASALIRSLSKGMDSFR